MPNSNPNDDFYLAREVVNRIFYPMLESKLESLNVHLVKKYGVRVGLEINWFFEKIE